MSNHIITAEDCAKKTKISELKVSKKYVYWLEADSLNKGRQHLWQFDIERNKLNKYTSSEQYNIKSTINEYGGGSYWLNNEILYFFNKDDQNIYKIYDNTITITNALSISSTEKCIYINYADGIVLDNNSYIAVRERVSDNISIQELIYYDFNLDQVVVLDDQHDFYCFPRFNKDNNKLIWISREHPNMPWDHSKLYIADLEGSSLNDKIELINIDNNSLYQPEWFDDNNIFIVSEHDKDLPYWNLYLYNINNNEFKKIISGEFELAMPLWQLSSNTYDICKSDNNIKIYYNKISAGQSEICMSEFDSKFNLIKTSTISNPCVYIQDNLYLSNNNLYIIGSSLDKDLSVYQGTLSLSSPKFINIIEDKKYPKKKLAPREIQFTNNLGQKSFGFFYEPGVKSHQALPALIVICHGGPTASTNIGYSTKIQYWTSRGFAVVDVNYGGSTSYGKVYRDRIKHNYGIVDVADCAAAAEYLVEQNLVDKNKVFIKGSSSGGMTVLTALYKYDIFTAGCCYYPVCDLLALDEHTHNFEMFYNDYLIGNKDEVYSEYINRSPINFADKITKPVLIFHGDEDKVIDISQSRELFNKLNANNEQNKFVEIPGEGHGFRSCENIKATLEEELEFYLLCC